ncbi:MAG: hypothetical protein IJR04_04730 [Bacteroidales bacterium]|nr:hypothetical protein [Bacteroidales bacterium]
MKKNILFLALAIVALCSQGRAQLSYSETNHLFYHTLRTPQSTLDNVALFPTNNTFYIMFPGVDMQFSGPLKFNDIVYYDKSSNRTLINLDTIFRSMNESNDFHVGADINLFGFGFKAGNNFITFNTRLVNNVNMCLPTETINTILHGNMDENNAVIPEIEMLNGDILNVTSYLETGIGYARYIPSIDLTVGARVKLLYGVANVQTDNTKIVFNSNTDSLSANLYYEIQSSTFAPYDTNQKKFIFNVGDILSNANTGLSFDIGAKYDFGPLTFSFAINDLTAGIHWKHNVTTWKPTAGQGVITFNGLDVSTMLNNGVFSTDSLSNYLNDQFESMKPTQENEGDYWFSIPTKLNIGASYSFAKILRLGLLLHGQFDRGLLCKSSNKLDLSIANTFRFNTTLSLGANLYNWAEIIVGSSVVHDGSGWDFFNPGIGIVLTPATVFQLYFMADYVSSFYLIESKAFNLKFGINLLFGKGGRSQVYGI